MSNIMCRDIMVENHWFTSSVLCRLQQKCKTDFFADFKVDVHLKPHTSSDLLSNNVESSQKNNATTMTSSGGGKKKKRSKERARSVDNVSRPKWRH